MLIIKEHTSHKYSPRTYYKGKMAETTNALAVDLSTAGEISTKKAAGDKYIGFLLEEDSISKEIGEELAKFMTTKNANTLNIAGNGIYTLNKYECSQEHINNFVFEVIYYSNQIREIKKIYTGGQTGVDLAGAIAGNVLGIETEVTMPKGFIQRDKDKIDKTHAIEDIYKQIDYYSKKIKLF